MTPRPSTTSLATQQQETRRDTSFSLVRRNEQWLSKDTTPLSDNQSRHLRTTLSLRTIRDGPDDITTGVPTWCLRGIRDIQDKMRHDMAGDTSRSETRRVGPGRPRRRCFRGLTTGSRTIAPAGETVTNGVVGMTNLQWI